MSYAACAAVEWSELPILYSQALWSYAACAAAEWSGCLFFIRRCSGAMQRAQRLSGAGCLFPIRRRSGAMHRAQRLSGAGCLSYDTQALFTRTQRAQRLSGAGEVSLMRTISLLDPYPTFDHVERVISGCLPRTHVDSISLSLRRSGARGPDYLHLCPSGNIVSAQYTAGLSPFVDSPAPTSSLNSTAIRSQAPLMDRIAR